DSPNYAERFMGDYIGIAATPTMAYPVWADDLNACYTVDPTWGCVDQDAFTSTIASLHNPSEEQSTQCNSLNCSSHCSKPYQ
ncbi:MAG TPA: hypothetical protein VE955_05100, partial [Candidatus Dormibacteraeota bacterium]|nr:hypothetical protein [Candidatus Dormibacteraeota bacterium]